MCYTVEQLLTVFGIILLASLLFTEFSEVKHLSSFFRRKLLFSCTEEELSGFVVLFSRSKKLRYLLNGSGLNELLCNMPLAFSLTLECAVIVSVCSVFRW